MKELLLVALPWQRYDTTAIQLGGLQSFIKNAGYQVDTRHFYKDLIDYISPDVYMKLFEAYMGECVFAALLYPDRYKKIKKSVLGIVDFEVQSVQTSETFRHPQLNSNLSKAEREQMSRSAKKITISDSESSFDFDALVKTLNLFLNDVFLSVNWKQYRLIGFTTSHQQLVPTVLLSKMIKKAYPGIPIVIGGALMTQGIPRAVMEIYPSFDYIVSGEGELTLLELLQFLTGTNNAITVGGIKGLYWKKENKTEIIFNGDRSPMRDLDVLPIPDYDDYFNHSLKEGNQWVFPKLTLEASRACVWGRCVYCNLNLQWKNKYRRKSHNSVVKEIRTLSNRYKSNVVTLCDTNVIDKVPLFEMLAQDSNDYRILAEVSPHMTKRGMKALRDAGVRTIQVGIESFSHRIIELYARGHTVMRSIEMLKWATEYDLEMYYNIIINFPLDEDADVERSLSVMRYASHFMYPAIHDFSFAMDSPAYNNKEKFNIAGYEYPEEIWEVYPGNVVEKLGPLLSLTVHPVAKNATGVNWDPVIQHINQWKSRYHGNLGRPGMVYLDGGDYITISVRNGGEGNDLNIVLEDEYRTIYLACNEKATSLEKILEIVPHIHEGMVTSILNELNDVGVVYCENNQFFGLAIRENSIGNYPYSKSKSNKMFVTESLENSRSRQREIKIKLPKSIS